MDEITGMSETELRRQIVERLAAAKHAAPLSRRLVRDAAAACGVGESTMWRWIACGAPPSRTPGGVVASERAVELLLQWRGNVAAAHRQLLAEGGEVPSRRTLARAFGRALSPVERDFARRGDPALRDRAVYLRHEARFRGECYEADHKQLSIEVLAPRAQRPRRPIDRVRDAIKARAIDYPIVVDNDYAIWAAFANHYWPALHFVDADGIIRDRHFGEGRYEQSEHLIQRLLGIDRDPAPVEGLGIEAGADWDNLRTPETYLGYERSERFVSTDGAAFDERCGYVLPKSLRSNHWGLGGEWTIGAESVVLEAAGGAIAYRFHARDVHLVLCAEGRQPIPFRVLLDGEAPGQSHGVDVDEDGNGLLRDGYLYQLVRQHHAVRERTLEITFRDPGAEAYAFTFG